MLATAGIRGEKITLATVRGDDLRAMFARLAGEGDVVAVCDAETDHDLHLIAEASLPASPATFFIGSAGLAHALAGFEAGDVAEPPRNSGERIRHADRGRLARRGIALRRARTAGDRYRYAFPGRAGDAARRRRRPRLRSPAT